MNTAMTLTAINPRTDTAVLLKAIRQFLDESDPDDRISVTITRKP